MVRDKRLTHQQSLDASCITRPTVPKVLRELLPMGVIRFVGAGDFRRIHARRNLAGKTVSCRVRQFPADF